MAEKSVYEQILTEVRSKIRSLRLDGISDANVLLQKVPSDRDEFLPANLPVCIVGVVGAPRIDPRSANSRDAVQYPVLIAFVQKSGNITADAKDSDPQVDNRDRMMLWQQKVRRAFIHQRLPAGRYFCTVEPRDTFNQASFFQNGHDAGSMMLRFRSEETRGG